MNHSNDRIAFAATGLTRTLIALPLLCGVSLAACDVAQARGARHAVPKIAATQPPQPVWPAKPTGTVILAVSLNDERLTIWDDGVVVARSPISTGVPGHPTPHGIFSVVQKQKFHRSNLYSAAPMPFMQRITWSGVALHEGHVTGHPASHGCIRLPREVAIKLFSYTSMGVRVIITNDPITPASFSHPNLFAALPASNKSAGDLPSPGARAIQLAQTPASVSEAEAKPATQEPAAEAKTDLKPEVAAQETPAAATPEPVQQTEAAPPAAAPVTAAQAPAEAPAAAPAATAEAAPPALTPAPAPALAAEVPPAEAPATTVPAPVVAAPVTVPAPAVAAAPKRTGHVALFVSAREHKLFVRQGFEPVYETPVTIADAGKPLGTHLYTAMQVKQDDGSVRWTSVTVPDAPQTPAMPRARKGEPAPVAPTLPPASSASEALDRITIPDEARQKVAELMSAGASLIVSDQGFGSETGKRGTDFVVVTH